MSCFLPARPTPRPSGSFVAILACFTVFAPWSVAAAEGGFREAPSTIVPAPKVFRSTGRAFLVRRDARVGIAAPSRPTMDAAAKVLCDWLGKRGFAPVAMGVENAASEEALHVVLQSSTDVGDKGSQLSGSYRIRVEAPNNENESDRVRVTITGADDVGTLYGCYTFLKSLERSDTGLRIPEVEVNDEPALAVRGLSPQWAWYLGQRGPYGAALWRLPEWKRFLDLMAEYRLNMLALCTYGRFPMRLPGHESLCAVDLPFEIWDPDQGMHAIRWTHPAHEDDFVNAMIDYAHQRGIQVLVYTCMNLQDDAGSQRWTDEAELGTYCDIFQQMLRLYKFDGFILESGEYSVTHADDLARFGNDQWSRMRADLFLTHRFDKAIREVRPDAVLGLVDHYLFKDWDERGVPQRTGLERWMPELPPKTLLAYVASPEAYDVFPRERIWTYVFGPKGGLKPALQIHLADCCDAPRENHAAGAYYVTYDFSPHEVDYLCFAESAWGNYGEPDDRAFTLHSSEPGVGGPISGRVWDNLVRDCYGQGSRFGEGLLAAGKGTWPRLWDAQRTLHDELTKQVVPALRRRDFAAVEAKIAAVQAKAAATEKGLAMLTADPKRHEATMLTEFPFDESMQKAIALVRVQRSWLRFVGATYETALSLAKNPNQSEHAAAAIDSLRAMGKTEHASIRDALDKAYFHYPHDKLGKFEFLADPMRIVADLAPLAARPADGHIDAARH